MSGPYINVSGVDHSEQPSQIYVWCRAEGRNSYALVETGHAIGAKDVRPPGIHVGQFSITFRLPAGCAADSLFVTSDKDATELLRDVAVTRCT